MRKSLLILVTAVAGVIFSASLWANASSGSRVGSIVGSIADGRTHATPATHVADGGGDDLFPWPWGTECSFPWQEIKGSYTVNSPKGGNYNGHSLVISVSEKDGSDLEFLDIKEYDRQDKLYATGQGYAQTSDRIVKGLLTSEKSGRTYTVMMRTYAKDLGSPCNGKNLVTAVTFCPLRGKKCQSEPNYLLERM